MIRRPFGPSPFGRLPLRECAAILGLLAVAGCGDETVPHSTITGQVTLDGEPVTVGIVQFINEEIGVGAKGDLDDEGRYLIDTPFRTGHYEVAILPPPPPDPILGGPEPKGPFIVPQKYASFETSGLSADLTEGKNTVDFALTRE